MATTHLNRSRLFAQVAEKNEKLPPKKVELIIRYLIEEMSKQLVAGNDVTIRQLGSWRTRVRNTTRARNPKTGESIKLSKRQSVTYRHSKHLFYLLNPNLQKSMAGKKQSAGKKLTAGKKSATSKKSKISAAS